MPHDHPSSAVLLDRGWRYDLEVWFIDTFVLHGEMRRLRQKVIDLVNPSPGQRVLDVGCGTGTLAIGMARRATGVAVTGIEPAPRQIAWARTKARRARVDVDFRSGGIEDLSFADGTFDAVTSTLMMHHLPEDVRRDGLAEIARVTKPQGRLVIADFDHGDFGETKNLQGDVQAAGFTSVEVEQARFARRHRQWTGASIISATRLDA